MRGANIDLVARARLSLREVASENGSEAPLAVTLLRAEAVRERQTGGELAQELEQWEVGAKWPARETGARG